MTDGAAITITAVKLAKGASMTVRIARAMIPEGENDTGSYTWATMPR